MQPIPAPPLHCRRNLALLQSPGPTHFWVSIYYRSLSDHKADQENCCPWPRKHGDSPPPSTWNPPNPLSAKEGRSVRRRGSLWRRRSPGACCRGCWCLRLLLSQVAQTCSSSERCVGTAQGCRSWLRAGRTSARVRSLRYPAPLAPQGGVSHKESRCVATKGQLRQGDL